MIGLGSDKNLYDMSLTGQEALPQAILLDLCVIFCQARLIEATLGMLPHSTLWTAPFQIARFESGRCSSSRFS